MERDRARCREGTQLLADQLTVVEKRLNFLPQKADKNQQTLMAGDATLPMKFAFPQVTKPPKMINKNSMSSVLLGFVGQYFVLSYLTICSHIFHKTLSFMFA